MRSVTHKAQGDVTKMHDEALRFLETTKPMLSQPHRHQAFIINMDQTPYNPKDTERRTLNEKGVKTVNAKTMKTSLDRITCMLTVCADGTKLPPLLIFKAKPGGSVEREFANFPEGCVYFVQENAWTDERVMTHWVDHVLAPYVKTAPKGIVIFFLTSILVTLKEESQTELKNLEWNGISFLQVVPVLYSQSTSESGSLSRIVCDIDGRSG